MTLSSAEKLAHSTVKIECQSIDRRVSTGTGFFFLLRRDEKRSLPVIITNQHVVRGASTGRFLMTMQDENGGPATDHHTFELSNFQNGWRVHPDPEVDLCAMPIGQLMNLAGEQGSRLFLAPLDLELLPSKSDIENMIGLENIVMVGYPNGLWDEKNNQPVFRKGIMASSYKHDWNGRREFLIDAACFPGSSGSPVLLFDIGGYQDRTGMNIGASRIKLLGVLYAGPQHTAQGDVQVVTVPTQQKAVSLTGIPNNLGFCIKSEAIRDFEILFEEEMKSSSNTPET